jgi:hypothetical protein
MNSPLILTALCASLAVAGAQEKIPAEKVQSVGHKLLENLGEVSAAQVKVEPNADKGDAFSVKDAAVLVLPDKNLTAAVLEKTGGRIIPLGQLFLKELSPVKDGFATTRDQLRTVMFSDKGEEHRIALLLLGVRKLDDRLELVVFGKDEAPLLQVPLRRVLRLAQDLPVELSGEKEDEETGKLTLNVFGKFKASFLVRRAEG